MVRPGGGAPSSLLSVRSRAGADPSRARLFRRPAAAPPGRSGHGREHVVMSLPQPEMYIAAIDLATGGLRPLLPLSTDTTFIAAHDVEGRTLFVTTVAGLNAPRLLKVDLDAMTVTESAYHPTSSQQYFFDESSRSMLTVLGFFQSPQPHEIARVDTTTGIAQTLVSVEASIRTGRWRHRCRSNTLFCRRRTPNRMRFPRCLFGRCSRWRSCSPRSPRRDCARTSGSRCRRSSCASAAAHRRR